MGIAALALAMWLANSAYRASLAPRDVEEGEADGVAAEVSTLTKEAKHEEAAPAAGHGDSATSFDEPDYTIRGLLHTSAYSLLAGVLAGAPRCADTRSCRCHPIIMP